MRQNGMYCKEIKFYRNNLPAFTLVADTEGDVWGLRVEFYQTYILIHKYLGQEPNKENFNVMDGIWNTNLYTLHEYKKVEFIK
jgi:hypothetical protein